MGIAERKNRQKQALRERILDAARRIVMREGFAALSMRKIADAIEYSPATLYLHFASRDEIARALCAEGYAQLLETFVPLARIADPGERLKALGRAYVAFGVAHPETYRLIFMEDPSYTGAALGGAAGAAKARTSADAEAGGTPAGARQPATVTATSLAAAAATAEGEAAGEGSGETAAAPAFPHDADAADEGSGKPATVDDDPDAAGEGGGKPAASDDDPDAAALNLMIAALEELQAAGRLSPSTDLTVWAEAFWATLHGIVALNLTCPVFPTAPLDTVLSLALDAWLGASNAPAHAGQTTGPTTAQSPEQSTAHTTGQSTGQSTAQTTGQSTAQPTAQPDSMTSAADLSADPDVAAAADRDVAEAASARKKKSAESRAASQPGPRAKPKAPSA